MSAAAWKAKCETYLTKRTGTYEFRCKRYDAVANILSQVLDLREWDVVYDLGAGMCEFDRRLRQREQHYRYVPVDGCIDGTDLNDWHPPNVDAFVMIEVIEHLDYPGEFLYHLKQHASKGIVLTTPNAARVDVLGMDETHKHALTKEFLEARGFTVKALQLFNDYEDTLLAWWKGGNS